MATSSITANFYCDDAKAYLPIEASFAQQSGYSSANAFVRAMMSTRGTLPSRKRSIQFVDITDPKDIRAFFRGKGAA